MAPIAAGSLFLWRARSRASYCRSSQSSERRSLSLSLSKSSRTQPQASLAKPKLWNKANENEKLRSLRVQVSLANPMERQLALESAIENSVGFARAAIGAGSVFAFACVCVFSRALSARSTQKRRVCSRQRYSARRADCSRQESQKQAHMCAARSIEAASRQSENASTSQLRARSLANAHALF